MMKYILTVISVTYSNYDIVLINSDFDIKYELVVKYYIRKN